MITLLMIRFDAMIGAAQLLMTNTKLSVPAGNKQETRIISMKSQHWGRCAQAIALKYQLQNGWCGATTQILQRSKPH